MLHTVQFFDLLEEIFEDKKATCNVLKQKLSHTTIHIASASKGVNVVHESFFRELLNTIFIQTSYLI